MGRYYRFEYVIYAGGYKSGGKKKINFDIRGIMFTFSDKQTESIELLKDRVTDRFSEYIEDNELFSVEITEAEENFEPVNPEESRGIGFYYPVIEVNGSQMEKADVRRGLWRTLWSFVGGLLK